MDNQNKNPMNWNTSLLRALVEPPEQYSVFSEWDSLWVPKFYGRDQNLIVNQSLEYLFYEDIPGWILRYTAEHGLVCPPLIFRGTNDIPWGRIITLNVKVLHIHSSILGDLESVKHISTCFEARTKTGKIVTVNTEEMPLAIWDTEKKIWSKERQYDDWSMSVKIRILDRDPQSIFSKTETAKPFCTDECSDDDLGDSLSIAANAGDIDQVHTILDKGVNINFQNSFCDTALFRAARKNFVDIVRLLLQAGANPNQQNRTGWVPLHSASVQGFTEVVELLLKNGAIVDPRNKNGWTPLFLAAGSGHIQIVQQLLDAGADVEAEDGVGNTPINNAQKHGYQEIVHLLKEKTTRKIYF
ncbi:MAG: ankyrin repeat domain-containing protein [Planctomycetaceae bacterium]|jgi:hypothetical protein|nr:ankyrin repeat domain-containing protein [Planctomycetaceae bacterium]